MNDGTSAIIALCIDIKIVGCKTVYTVGGIDNT